MMYEEDMFIIFVIGVLLIILHEFRPNYYRNHVGKLHWF